MNKEDYLSSQISLPENIKSVKELYDELQKLTTHICCHWVGSRNLLISEKTETSFRIFVDHLNEEISKSNESKMK